MKNTDHPLNESDFICLCSGLSVKGARKLNRKARRREMLKSINFEKVLVYGVALGISASMLYLLLILTAYITA